MTPPTATPRPDSLTLDTIKTVGTPKEPWELQDRLGRNKLIEWVLKYRSGKMANTTPDLQQYYGLVTGYSALGLANDAELIMLDEIMANSGDYQGKNKLQGVQLLEEKNILLPGGAGLYPPIEPNVGIIQRIKTFFGWG